MIAKKLFMVSELNPLTKIETLRDTKYWLESISIFPQQTGNQKRGKTPTICEHIRGCEQSMLKHASHTFSDLSLRSWRHSQVQNAKQVRCGINATTTKQYRYPAMIISRCFHSEATASDF